MSNHVPHDEFMYSIQIKLQQINGAVCDNQQGLLYTRHYAFVIFASNHVYVAGDGGRHRVSKHFR